jgi:hypothetical protein
MKKDAAETEFQKADWKSVGLRLLLFARYWAKAHYGWYEGKLMPGAHAPEDVACEVYAAFRRGTRRFNDKDAMWIQLKRAVKSVLWNIHTLKESRITSAEEPEFFDPISDEKPNPEAELRTAEFYEEFFRLMYADSRVKRNDDLRKTIQAFEKGAREVSELEKEAGLSKTRVYEMRRVVKTVAENVLNKMNRDGADHEQKISIRNAKTA